MYYVLEKNSSLSNTYAYFSQYPDGYDSSAWISGTAFLNLPDRFSLVCDAGRPTKPSDLLLTRFNLLVASPRLVELLNSLRIQNLSYHPVGVVDEDGAEIATGYQAVQIIGRCACLDKNNAELMYSADGQTLLSVEEFTLIEDNIRPLAGAGEKPLIFRLEEFSHIALAHESIKEAFESNGIAGAKFTRTEDYL